MGNGENAPVEHFLTEEEIRLLQCYRAATDRAQIQMQTIAAGFSKDFPRHSKPSLKLVKGGAE
ncbi:hypothetical protein GTP23_12860 [Pseudoduganella sp. FT93W]|uniref:Uncharacterized protein n=1 Tax=Duganella fentianensis TaxID=2692177 RepID=A0A845HY67_9BURK|nr:hypothetical protein [Duganella fentianensis]MYN45939.1 hypothetical protein [Duganella fentianensis]